MNIKHGQWPDQENRCTQQQKRDITKLHGHKT